MPVLELLGLPEHTVKGTSHLSVVVILSIIGLIIVDSTKYLQHA